MIVLLINQLSHKINIFSQIYRQLKRVLFIINKLNKSISINNLDGNAAVVLFGKQSFDHPQCLLRLARFKGTDKNEFLDNQQVHGNIFDLLDAAMNFFFKHLSLSSKIESLYRNEELSIPVKALRENCINSFCHRSYSLPGSSVGIAIYDDRVEIENSGTFPQGMTIDKLKGQHHSVPTNPLIANVLYKSKVLESWGRGIGLMFSECQRVGLPEPDFHTDGTCVWVIFRRTDQVTDQVIKLVKTIGNQSLSIKEIMALLDLSHRPSFRTTYLHPALTSGYIIQQ